MEIMKLFKKALLATAVFGAMGAQAATISSTPLKLSAEGVALKVAPTAGTLAFDIVVDKEHASSSTITLNFDKNVDLTGLTCAGAVTQAVGGGKATCGDIGFDYGTGSFTFDNVVFTDGDRSKGETDSLTFKVNLGNPLTANSAFRVTIGAHGYSTATGDANLSNGSAVALVYGASSLGYVSNKSDTAKTEIETGSGVIANEISQFGFKVDTKLDGLIKRDDLTSFVGANGATVKTDSVKYTFVNDESLALALQTVNADIRLSGNFKGTLAEAVLGTPTAGELTVGQSLTVINNTATTPVAIAVNDAYVAATPGSKETYVETAVFTNESTSTTEIPVTGDVEASVTVTSTTSSVTLPTGGYVAYSAVDAGKWAVDATIINVPYLPVNASNTDTFIHFANETDNEVDVIVTAIDNNGVEYGPMNLGAKLAANTVTKISEPAMDTLFGLNGASTKLSVTFNVDADKGDVTAYAVSQNDKGRTEVSTSQQRGTQT
jgi:hypothetical protein